MKEIIYLLKLYMKLNAKIYNQWYKKKNVVYNKLNVRLKFISLCIFEYNINILIKLL